MERRADSGNMGDLKKNFDANDFSFLIEQKLSENSVFFLLGTSS